MQQLGHYIAGSHQPAPGARQALVRDPASGEPLAQLAMAGEAEAAAAVAAAARAFPAWAATPAPQRARVLFRLRERLERGQDELAALISAEHGKLPEDARGEIARGMEVVEFACGIPQLLKGEHSVEVGRGVDSWSQLAPLGVVAGVTPFNFPAMVPLWMFPIALACGNSFVLKPSEHAPSAALWLAEQLAAAGLPPGVFNVLNGDREAVAALLAQPELRALSFVGSTPVAEQLYAEGSRRGLRVQALGGAKNHLVAMPDADLDAVADALLGAAYGAAGERCMAVSVAVAVGEATADALVARLAPRVAALRLGAASGPACDMGPLISAEHLQRVRGHVEAGVSEGAELVVDGRRAALPGAGHFLGGCLFDRVRPEMRIYREEIFGPVLCVLRAPDLEAALALVNAHAYGNGAAIFTRDGRAAREFSQRVEAGMVGVNVAIPVPMAFHSFGGWKRSLFGPLHMHGPDGVRFYTRMKTVTARWPEGGSGAQFSMPVAG